MGRPACSPTLSVVSRALDVSVTYVEAASKLSATELRQLRQGKLTLADFKPVAPASVKAKMTVDDVVDWWGTASESDRVAVVGKNGVTSTWDALAKHLV